MDVLAMEREPQACACSPPSHHPRIQLQSSPKGYMQGLPG